MLGSDALCFISWEALIQAFGYAVVINGIGDIDQQEDSEEHKPQTKRECLGEDQGDLACRHQYSGGEDDPTYELSGARCDCLVAACCGFRKRQ